MKPNFRVSRYRYERFVQQAHSIGNTRSIDFYADWCAPCKMLTPILKDLKSELGDRLKVVKIDVDANNAIAGRFQIRGVPTMMLFKEGKVLWRQSGVLPKDAILDAIGGFL